jgi:hypothetical protein
MELLTIKQASDWATDYLKKNVTTSNISYLIQYGRIKKIGSNGDVQIYKQDLIKYYNSYLGKREIEWKDRLGDDLNWALSFQHVKEAETTKHVHRLHPYKGKFIPQLVEYFLDSHTDNFKKEVYFKKGDIILDPFCGSGTALVQANELGMHAIGIDVSAFNTLISNVKTGTYNFTDLHKEIENITQALSHFIKDSEVVAFEQKLSEELTKFNNKYFPAFGYKYNVKNGEIDEDAFGDEKEKEFLTIYKRLIAEYNIQLKKDNPRNFLDKWYLEHIRKEIDFVFDLVKQVNNPDTKKILSIILSRTIRSCRATTHADLATLKEPVTTTYYCAKHGRICKPLFSILSWWVRYSKDTIERLKKFDQLRTNTYQLCLTGDSRTLDVIDVLNKKNPEFAKLVKDKKINGIFSSPPYVGLIDYHEQHAYAYELFGFKRRDELEIGPLSKGQGVEAKNSYVQGISDVLKHCKDFLANDYNIFLVANDKYNLYPTIAQKAGMRIVNQFKRPVLNRTEKDKAAYAEIIFHLKNGN